MPLFCRHNRFQHNCPICSKEEAAPRPATAPARPRQGRGTGTSAGPARPGRGRAGGMVIKRSARAADDGYSSPLVPGIRGSGDAERLAALIAEEEERLAALALDPPEPWAAVARTEDFGAAAEAAARLVAGTVPQAGHDDADRVLDGYRVWVERHGGAPRAFTGDPAWTPTRRFDRIFERLAFPGFGRARRYALLSTLGALGRIEVEAASLHFGVTGDDDATLAAKRILNSGDVRLLDRRAAALAGALAVPLASLDRSFAAFERGERAQREDLPALGRLRSALAVG